jgi:hypothetical protein
MDIAGSVHGEYLYADAGGRRALGPGGPDIMARDGFDMEWAGWYEKYLGKLISLVSDRWEQQFDSRRELKDHLGQKDRIGFLSRTYPGPFADAMQRDWERVRDLLAGTAVALTPADLEYRELGEKRIAVAKDAAARAWESFLAGRKPETIDPFPAVPVEKREKVAGRFVVLPRSTYRDIIGDLGRAYAVIGSPVDGYYFVVLDTPDLYRFYETLFRYRGQVNPRMPEQYRYAGRVQDDPRMIVIGGRAVTGLVVKPEAILAGENECFVDLRAAPLRFAGEDALAQLDGPRLPENPGPGDIIRAMIAAVKTGDEKTWRDLFVRWHVVTGDRGFPVIDWSWIPTGAVLASSWEASRRLITGPVYDARICREGRIRCLAAGNAAGGTPAIDETTVIVDHYGLFDGEYRSFSNTSVNRVWVLQRIDRGPWKIATVQHL